MTNFDFDPVLNLFVAQLRNPEQDDLTVDYQRSCGKEVIDHGPDRSGGVDRVVCPTADSDGQLRITTRGGNIYFRYLPLDRR